MLTQCPTCHTVFRVTGAVLRMAHGQVRCGRCQTQFDALERMLEEEDFAAELPIENATAQPVAEPEATATSKPAPAAQPMVVEERDALEEITLEGKRIEITGTYRVFDPDSADGVHEATQTVVEQWVDPDEDDGDQDEAVVATEIDTAAPPALNEDQSEVDIEPALGFETERAVDDNEAQQAALPKTVPSGTLPAETSSFTPRSMSSHALDDELAPGRKRLSILWTFACVACAMALAGQWVHHNRQDLARHPQVGTTLSHLYGALGLALFPNWNLHAYDVQQWGLISDPNQPGTLRVKASITNRAPFAQPYPLLQLALEDRWGGQVGARAFEPSEYMQDPTAAKRMLAPNQGTNAEVTIVDPGEDAVGFRLDVCLPRKAGVTCAAEEGTGR